jgi:hypothetical protein
MNPLRWDVVLVGLLLSLPVLALGLRGEFTPEEVANRVLWCLAAGWAVVAVLRLATTPPTVSGTENTPEAAESMPADGEHSPAV